MNKNNLKVFLVYFIYIFYFELCFRLFCLKTYSFKMLLNVVYLIPLCLLLSFISRLFYKKGNLVCKIILFLTSIYFGFEIIFYKIFNFYFSVKSSKLAGNLTDFFEDTVKDVLHNWFYVLLCFLPFIIYLIIDKYIKFERINKKNILLYLILIVNGFSTYYLICFLDNDLNKLVNYTDNSNLYKTYVGVEPTLFLDIRRIYLPFDGEIISVSSTSKKSIKSDYGKNELDIDFDTLISEEDNSTLLNMHNYFSNEESTNKNEYTGMFKNKNIILFMAESFNGVVISKELTPTLYKLSTNGFVFNNYYSPVIYSTIGGEFQELTGLYPSIDLLSGIWRKSGNSYSWGIANQFKNIGYNAYAYHDNQYNFQNRDNYLKSLGFDNYLGCYNGLEERINCNIWPESDVEMISTTVDDYIDEDKFIVYYATVSGHMNYNWNNAISLKNKSYVEDTNYSESVKAYIATQIELDRALELLIDKLESADKLDDTVIVLAGDHYPYSLSIDEINEMSDYEKDDLFEVNKSNLIVWNNKMEKTEVNKIASQMDIIPTIYNLFGINYDSRLFIGKDILSDCEGLVIFNNQSWITDSGRYNTITKEYSDSLDSEYINNINNIVSNRVNMSKLLLKYNYYDLVTKKVE